MCLIKKIPTKEINFIALYSSFRLSYLMAGLCQMKKLIPGAALAVRVAGFDGTESAERVDEWQRRI